MVTRRFIFWLAFLGAGLQVFSNSAMAYRANPPSGRTGSPGSGGATCKGCHGAAVGTGSVQIMDAPSRYQANAVYNITVRVSDPAKFGAGFQLSVETTTGTPAGSLSVIDSVNTQLNGDDPNWINHTSDGVDNSAATWGANGNSADYAIRWTAPATDVGAITFWAAGNAINDNNNFTGDTIYLANQVATFVEVPAVSDWGLAILALVTLTCGTLTIRRRQSATNA